MTLDTRPRPLVAPGPSDAPMRVRGRPNVHREEAVALRRERSEDVTYMVEPARRIYGRAVRDGDHDDLHDAGQILYRLQRMSRRA